MLSRAPRPSASTSASSDRHRSNSTFSPYAHAKPLRIFGAGTLFLTHTLTLTSPTALLSPRSDNFRHSDLSSGLDHDEEPKWTIAGSSARAQGASRTRGGAVPSTLRAIAQLPGVSARLVAPLAGDAEGRAIRREIEEEGVNTRYCRVYEGLGVPSAWVMRYNDGQPQTVINHNPLPDLSHADFVSLLGPLLAPENYRSTTSPTSPPLSSPIIGGPPPIPIHTYGYGYNGNHNTNNNNPQQLIPPFEWLHIDARNARTALQNLAGVASLAAERGWRQRCVLSLDLARLPQDADALLPHADILFLPPPATETVDLNSSSTTTFSPRDALLALAAKAAPHALLIQDLGPGGVGHNPGGAALLSVPRREYMQASAWIPTPLRQPLSSAFRGSVRDPGAYDGVDESVRGDDSTFYAGEGGDGGEHSRSTSAWTAFGPNASGVDHPDTPSQGGRKHTNAHVNHEQVEEELEDAPAENVVVDVPGARAAFIAGMIWALSRAELPSHVHSPPIAASASVPGSGLGTRAAADTDPRGRKVPGLGPAADARWRMDECLRFASEFSGRKARIAGWDGPGLGQVVEAMATGGWFADV